MFVFIYAYCIYFDITKKQRVQQTAINMFYNYRINKEYNKFNNEYFIVYTAVDFSLKLFSDIIKVETN